MVQATASPDQKQGRQRRTQEATLKTASDYNFGGKQQDGLQMIGKKWGHSAF
jgi:hypothetical protein